ncbi:hypothetical protein [Cellulomonas wangsupingiae]|uniref:Peptidase M1 membrane alanine aminopeptidase domain-containing protein n=1 Tax=Cellulomonas wangsupingiae TaxID=2968085 RepID=A0ABY5K8Y7_9CELL|nr:hypothetical protein [Cellulomonas wangsupingiae]MCC2335092.1 hypothetical protein [Cellulomonas wangsupingiae]UUI65587.1 hypothetical protein NP075_02280 [Cellulomonas wangsupingiae]
MTRETRAAVALGDLVQRLAPAARHARIYHRGHGRVWQAWARELRIRGLTVVVTASRDDDHGWAPPADDGTPASIDVYHDPFGPHPAGQAGLDTLRNRTSPLIVVDYPHGLRDPALSSALEDRYLDALAVPWYESEARARAYAAAMASSPTLRVEADDARFTTQVLDVRTDVTSFERDVPVVQVPLGEAWAVLAPGSTRGRARVRDGARHSLLVDLTEPWRGDPAVPAGAVVELGVGTNDRAPWLPGASLGEKTRGRLHLGSGDSALIGGGTVADDHSDVSLAPGSRLVLTRPRGLARELVVDSEDGDWCVVSETGYVLVARARDASGPAVLGTTVTDGDETRTLGAADLRAHLVGHPSRGGSLTNVSVLHTLGDPRLADVAVVPCGRLRTNEVARFRTDGTPGTGYALEPDVHAVWCGLLEALGPLPWDEVVVVASGLEWPRALAFPGLVLLADELLASPGKLRWVYLVHELVHQWLGGLVRTQGSRDDAAEWVTDALALAVLRRVRPVQARALTRVHERARESGPTELAERGRQVLALVRDEPTTHATVSRAAAAATESWASMRTLGVRASSTGEELGAERRPGSPVALETGAALC